MKGKGREEERERNGGDFQHAPQPLVSSPPELKKGDRARHMPGERERVPVVPLRVWVYGPAINAWRTLVRAYVRASVRACVCACVPCPQLPLLVPVASAVEDCTKDKVILVI